MQHLSKLSVIPVKVNTTPHKYKNILPTNALFIKNIKCYNVYLTPTCFGFSWTIIREYTFVPR
jgi:hypothetical protein